MLRVLAFDVFGTVVDWRSGVVAVGARLATRHGFRIDWPAFADAWRDGYHPSLEGVRRGELPWTKLDLLHRMTLNTLIPRFGLDSLSEPERDELNRAWHHLPPWPDAIEVLTRLRRRFVITTLSNGNVSLLTEMAKASGLPWDCILSAELVQHYKPDREAYLQVPNFLDVTPDQVLMVAAHPTDLEAARQAGLRTGYVHRPLEFGHRTPALPVPVGPFDYVARDFIDLAGQLGA
ncbi:MAG TPA: haloacid dehalogenase type II [Gemmatimonadales bacterium]|nr:haloacid dehalogenase type II [Gemmatimonadales bacterium]